MARIQKMRTTAPVREIRVRPLDSNKVASIERRTEDIRQMIVPATLEVGANHILSQNRESTYLQTLYVVDYPRDVEGNWLKDVLNLDFNLDVSLHIRPLDIQHARRRTAEYKDRKSTRLNSSHSQISYAVFCLKKKKKRRIT